MLFVPKVSTPPSADGRYPEGGLSITGSEKSVQTALSLQYYSPNPALDQGLIGWNCFWNGRALDRNNTQFTGVRFGANVGPANINAALFVTFATITGSHITILDATMNSAGTAITMSFPVASVGINTTSPTATLDVAGTTRMRGNLTLDNTINMTFSTSTGTKIGTATGQKIGFWDVAPVVQPTIGGTTAAVLVGGGGTTLTDTDTFDGYTLAKVVKALRNVGILA